MSNNPYLTIPSKSKPFDPIEQLSLCCGLTQLCKRPYRLEQPLIPFYGSPLDAASGWALANQQQQQQNLALFQQQQKNHQLSSPQQPYILLTQPVILATSPIPNQTNTMCLVQTATGGPHSGVPNQFQAIPWDPMSQAIQQHHGGLISSQYAIYQTSSGPMISGAANFLTSAANSNPLVSVGGNTISGNAISFPTNSPTTANLSPLVMHQHKQPQRVNSFMFNNQNFANPAPRTLDADTFRQLELIEKQVDLSEDLAHIEIYGSVITRPINPNSLRPYLTDSMLFNYKNLLRPGDGYVIRFMEVIKRPGQTLGLYIRSVQIEPNYGRVGLVITKIESDSPIYNSQVIHVGDEILSINLIDIKGMSIDDIVIMMSIPKRLVLAMRVPAVSGSTVNTSSSSVNF